MPFLYSMLNTISILFLGSIAIKHEGFSGLIAPLAVGIGFASLITLILSLKPVDCVVQRAGDCVWAVYAPRTPTGLTYLEGQLTTWRAAYRYDSGPNKGDWAMSAVDFVEVSDDGYKTYVPLKDLVIKERRVNSLLFRYD